MKKANEDLLSERGRVADVAGDLHEEREKSEHKKKVVQFIGVQLIFYTIWKQHLDFDFSFLGPSVEKVIPDF